MRLLGSSGPAPASRLDHGGARAVLLVLGALLGLALPRARAGEEAAHANLLERAERLLEDSERASNRRDEARALELARQAMKLIETAEGVRRDDVKAPFLGVQAAVLARDLDAARLWLTRFEQRNLLGDRNPAVHYVRAMIDLRLRGRADLALVSLDRMAALGPEAFATQRRTLQYAAHDAEGTRRFAHQDYDEAIQHFRAAARIARERGDLAKELRAEGNLGMVLQGAERWPQAQEVFAGLVRRDPENPYWRWRLGWNLATQSRWEEAIPHYEEVVRMLDAGRGAAVQRDELRTVHLRLGNSLRNVAAKPDLPAARRAGLLDAARREIARFQELAPDDVRGHYWMGVLLFLDLERPYDAIPHFRRAYELDPVCDHSLRQLIQIHLFNEPPPPSGGGPPDEAAQAAWTAELERLRADEATNKDARRKARERRVGGPAGDSGCE